MMVARGTPTRFVAGLTYHYPEVIRPALQVVGTRAGGHAGRRAYIMILGTRSTSSPTPPSTSSPPPKSWRRSPSWPPSGVRRFGVEPRVAMLSFSNFGSHQPPQAEKVRRAAEIVRERRPDLRSTARCRPTRRSFAEILEQEYPFSRLRGAANVSVFPDLAVGQHRLQAAPAAGGRRGHRAHPHGDWASRSTSSSGATTWTTSSTSPAWPSWTRRSWSGPPSILRCRRWRGGRRSSAEPTGTGRGRPQRPRFRHGGGWP